MNQETILMTKDQAINYFGSTTALAHALSISYQAVHSWPDSIPLLRQLQLEKMTSSALLADAPAPSELPKPLSAKVPANTGIGQPRLPAVNTSSARAAGPDCL
ncbi:Cro/CI family transcriptional regulator [Pseudomonas sp. W2-17]|uniref:Cro/CI family transcriptional regulator n=1 Tax=Pseudomonas sp. W2-17 TaxID=3058039 RepID=UPI0034E099EA